MLASVRGATFYLRVNERKEAYDCSLCRRNDSQILPTLGHRHVKVKILVCGDSVM